MDMLQMDPAMMVAAAVIGLGLLGLAAEALLSTKRRTASAKSPIMVVSDRSARTSLAAASVAPVKVETPQAIEVAREPAEVAAPEPAKDPLAEQRRFFSTLGAALTSNDEALPFALSALHANLSADVFMERMTLAAKGWRPDGFGAAGRKLLLKADGTPPDMVAEKVLEGYEQLKLGHVREALDAFLAGIEAAKVAAAENPGNAWPHAWSAFAWRGLALIAEESGDVQATLAGLKVAYQSMVNAFEITMTASVEQLADAA
jgi:tetratricopeptide (TPR) repeat protein